MTASPFIITAISEYALQLLQKHPFGIIHSVYRKTINLSLNGQLLALQTYTSPLSPLSLITKLNAEQMECLPVKEGDPVKIQNGVLSLHHCCMFSWNAAYIHNLKLSEQIPKTQIPSLTSLIRETLSMQSAGGFELLFTDKIPPDDTLILVAARKYLSKTRTYLLQRHWNEASHTLCRLIGLGLGLTPSGDDFLCGVLAGLHLCGLLSHPFYPALSSQIQVHLTDTNDISAAFLHCALQGQFSLAVNRLPSMISASQILSVFREIGHSSGTDTLCGIYYVLSTLPLLT